MQVLERVLTADSDQRENYSNSGRMDEVGLPARMISKLQNFIQAIFDVVRLPLWPINAIVWGNRLIGNGSVLNVRGICSKIAARLHALRQEVSKTGEGSSSQQAWVMTYYLMRTVI